MSSRTGARDREEGWYRKATRRELRRENEELRDALGLRGYRTIEDWEALPSALRDPLAARAFISEWGTRDAL